MPGTSPDFWIDIYDASEGKVGAGPITTCTSWTDSNALNRIGSFRCTIPAGEAKLALIPMRGYLKCYSIRGDMTDLVSVGLIRKRRTFTNKGGAAFVEFSGPSYGDELNFRLVHDLEISELTAYCPAEAQWHIPDADLPTNEQPWNVDLTEDGMFFGNPNPLQRSLCDGDFTGRWYFNRPWPNGQNSGFPNTGYFYFGNEEPFYQVHIYMTRDYTDPPFGSLQGRPATWELQYFNGGDMGWDTVPAGEWEDGTVGGNENTFGHSGIISWTEDGVENWTRTNHIDRNLYWIRMKPNVHLDDFDLSEVEILVHTKTTDDLQPILDYAPPGWDLVGTGTQAGSYIQFSGETVMAALNKVAEQSGERFRISNRGRFVTWLQGSVADSAGVLLLRADGGAQESSVTAFISSLEKLEASEDVVTRIYPYGSGNANARMKLSDPYTGGTGIEPPPEDRPEYFIELMGEEGLDEYETNYDDNYIENLSATARWGLIEREVQFNEIDEIQDDALGVNMAARQLIKAAVVWLKAHSEAQEDTYRVTVVGLEIYPYPGQTYRLLYQEERDGALSVNIQGSFVATEVTQTLTAGQAPTVSLVLTNNVLRRTMVTGQSRLARIEQAVRYQTKRQRTAHDNILDRVNERHSRPWHIIETAVEDPDGDISPLAKAIYRSIKDHGLAR